MYTNSITAEIADWSISESFVDVSKLDLYDGKIFLKKYEGDSTLNFQHIVDYFKPEEPDTTKSNFKVNVETIWLENIEFAYDDFNSEPKEHGLDYAHIHLKNFNSHFSEFNLIGDTIQVNIDDLHFQDESGLTLNKLQTDFMYCPEGIFLDNLQLGFINSWLFADHLNLETPNGSEDWSDFVNKVRFKAKLYNCKLSFRDLAYVVPQMWGMTDRVNINNIDVSGPVYGMKLDSVDIKMLDNTEIQGNFRIPDLSDINSAFFEEELIAFRTSMSDFEKMNLSPFLPDSTKKEYLRQFGKAGNIDVTKGSFIGGIEDFVVQAEITSGLGNFRSDYGIHFYMLRDEETMEIIDSNYYYDGPIGQTEGKEVIVDNLDLGTIAQNSMLGPVSGEVSILPGSHGFDQSEMDINFNAHFSQAYLNEYTYHNINVRNGSWANKKFSVDKRNSDLTIEDDNLALHYTGFVDTKGDMEFDFAVRIDSAHLQELLNHHDSVYHRFEADFKIHVKGNSLDNMSGYFAASHINYHDGKRDFTLDTMAVEINRHQTGHDTLKVRSKLLDLDLTGLFDLDDIDQVLFHQISFVVDNLVEAGQERKHDNEDFKLLISMKNINPLMQFLDTDLYVAENSRINSTYNRTKKAYLFDFRSDSLKLNDMKLADVHFENLIDSNRALLTYQAVDAQLNDSTQVRNLYIDSYIKKNKFFNTMGWDGLGETRPALFAFHSEVNPDLSVMTEFDPSFFYLQDHKWTINPKSALFYSSEEIKLEDFKVSHADNYIGLDGIISENPNDWLNFTVHDFNLEDINGLLIGTGIELGGILNVQGGVADLYKNLKLKSESDISDLYINDNLVGNLEIKNKWNQGRESIDMRGRLIREDIETFKFNGNIFPRREKNNLDLNLDFDKTDISFLNAFEDKELYTNIEGTLDGQLEVRGEFADPVIKGALEMANTKVFVPMFNVGYGLSGDIALDDGMITGDFLNLYDQKGTRGYVNMQVFHEAWQNWSYDIMLEMDEDEIDKFFVLNTDYREGDFYYGKAYITGSVNISGFGGKTTINVDAKTQKGTDLVLPMYGTSELSEESFVKFVDNDDTTAVVTIEEEIVERTGLELILNFDVTRDAKVKIPFDPLEADLITAEGEGEIEVTVDEYNFTKMFGTYTIRQGKYFMNLVDLASKEFDIINPSTVTWTQSPYDADINIKTRFMRLVSLAPILPNTGTERKQLDEVYGYLTMTDKLMSPDLAFDITAPKTDEVGKAAISSITSNKDMLKNQFFALLVLEGFIPTQGGGGGGAGLNLAIDAAEDQINKILSGIGGSRYSLATDFTDKSGTVDMSTQLGEKVTIKTSMGVVSSDNEETGGTGIVGDVAIEYRLNDDGSVNLTFFNESNTGSDADNGPFTQGIGLHYEETFRKSQDFKLLQSFLNIFRSKNHPEKKKAKERRKKKKQAKYRSIPPQ